MAQNTNKQSKKGTPKVNSYDNFFLITNIFCWGGLLIFDGGEDNNNWLMIRNIIQFVWGLIGLVFCFKYIRIFLIRPIKRDWLLIKEHFLKKVVNFVMFGPFVLLIGSSFSQIHDCCKLTTTSIEQVAYTTPNTTITDSAIVRTAEDSIPTLPMYEHKNNSSKEVEIQDEENPQNSETDYSISQKIFFNYIDPGSHQLASNKDLWFFALIDILGYFLLSGLMISTVVNWFEKRREEWEAGDEIYDKSIFKGKKFAIIIGANQMATSIIKDLLHPKKGLDYIILLTNDKVRKVRREIASYINEEEQQKLIIYHGELDAYESINKLYLEYSPQEIYILGESGHDDVSQSYHDTQNMHCVQLIADIINQQQTTNSSNGNEPKEQTTNSSNGNKPKIANIKRIPCWVLFEYQTTFTIFQTSKLPDAITRNLDFHPFNTYENWAQKVLVEGEYILPRREANENEMVSIKYEPLDGKEGITSDSENYVHFVIVGMSKMGIAMAIQAAQIAHYPNFPYPENNDNNERKPLRTRITFIDKSAEEEMHFVMGRFQHLFDVARHRFIKATNCKDYNSVEWIDPTTQKDSRYKWLGSNLVDIEWEFIEGGVEHPNVKEYLKTISATTKSDSNSGAILSIAICLPLAHEAIATAIYLPAEVYDSAQQILVYQREADDIIRNISKQNNSSSHLTKLRPFGMQKVNFTTSNKYVQYGKICNYLYDIKRAISKPEKFDPNNPDVIMPYIKGGYNSKDYEVFEKTFKETFNKEEELTDEKKNCIKIFTVFYYILKHKLVADKKVEELWNKHILTDQWSNIYLANNFKTKKRSVKYNAEGSKEEAEETKKLLTQRMAICEHNRWLVQQLLIGFRPYTTDELNKYEKLTDEEKRKDKSDKKSNKTHLDICTYELLKKHDNSTIGNDYMMNFCLPAIMELIDDYNKENQGDDSNETTSDEYSCSFIKRLFWDNL